MRSVEVPPLAQHLAAEAIGELPAFSTPELMASAALDVAWALVMPASRGVTREEIALVRELIARNYTWAETAGLLGCTISRVETITRSEGIRSVPGVRSEDRTPKGLEGLTETVRKAREF
jgi:hypothetical protein